MRTVIIIASFLFVTPASAASIYCALWPKSCQVPSEAPKVIEPPPVVQVSPPAPVVEPPPQVPVVVIPRVKPTKAKLADAAKPAVRIKSKFLKPKRKITVQASWCARVPSGTTLGMIEFAASVRGITMTEQQRQQARNCLTSKTEKPNG